MAAAYFNIPSFARAKKHTEDLAKTNPQSPVLSDEDEKFLEKISSHGNDSSVEINQTKVLDDGSVQDLDKTATIDHAVVPEDAEKVADDPPESVPTDEGAPALPPRPKSRKKDFIELPSQEEAEAATKGFAAGTQSAGQTTDKKTWASYLPSLPSRANSSSPTKDGDGRTWGEYASSIVPSNLPSLPSMPSIPSSWTRHKDAKPEPVLNEDGSINVEATKEKEEKEVSVLLDNLNLSSINNRVFAFTEESQKFYGRFVQVLKDAMNGVPTAYDDMEKLMKEAGPTIEKQWNSMPPFVQTLVKSLPAKLGAAGAPGMLAALGEKPGNDAKAMDAAVAQAEKNGDPSLKTDSKKKRKVVPGLKGLIKKKGYAATLLANITTFLRTRFPFLMGAGATNVVMSLSIFILMFVFYYCWKRGREVRLSKEAEAGQGVDDEDDDVEIDVTDEEAVDETLASQESEKITEKQL